MLQVEADLSSKGFRRPDETRLGRLTLPRSTRSSRMETEAFRQLYSARFIPGFAFVLLEYVTSQPTSAMLSFTNKAYLHIQLFRPAMILGLLLTRDHRSSGQVSRN